MLNSKTRLIGIALTAVFLGALVLVPFLTSLGGDDEALEKEIDYMLMVEGFRGEASDRLHVLPKECVRMFAKRLRNPEITYGDEERIFVLLCGKLNQFDDTLSNADKKYALEILEEKVKAAGRMSKGYRVKLFSELLAIRGKQGFEDVHRLTANTVTEQGADPPDRGHVIVQGERSSTKWIYLGSGLLFIAALVLGFLKGR